jgi:tetratricopeptide (TPR) repeat protein
MDVMASWTAGRADTLRQALRMSNEAFAGHLGIAVRTVAYWRQRPEIVPRPVMQEILDVALAQASEPARTQFRLLLAERQNRPARLESLAPLSALDDIADLTAWITATNTSDEAVGHIAHAAVGIADLHTQLPPRDVLAEVVQLHRTAQSLLRSGPQRLRQTRELLRIDGDLLAHAAVLLGDLGQDQAAGRHGDAALLCMSETEASQANAWYALAKTARWQHRYAQAADLARQGYEHSQPGPMRVQLASYEANSAALLGDRTRARTALVRAEKAAQALPARDTSGSPWAFPAERQAIFALSVALHTGDPLGALRAAERADDGWASGDRHIPGTWAQIRVGAAIACLLQDSLDGAIEQVTPMLTLAPEYRIATVTGWLTDLDKHLTRKRFAAITAAVSLRQQISDFNAVALPPQPGRKAG